jgi:phosphopantetheine adenylyltransferase
MPKKYEMKTVNTYDEAYQIGSKYVEHLSNSSPVRTREDNLPVQISNPMWEISLDSLRNSLKYICELLHHQCYMLCIRDNNILMCKLDMQTTAPIFQQAIDKHLANLDSNPTITEAQRRFIRESIGKNRDRLRVMQCIVKPFGEDKGGAKQDKENEYLQLLKGLDLPDGVFILNLTDAVILRNHGKSPFAMVTGKVQLDGEYVFDKHLPILSISGQRHYLDIPIPNYDDVMTVLKQTTVKSNTTRKSLHQYKMTQELVPIPNATNVKWDTGLVTDWAKKKKTRAVFRGGPTGCGYTAETNMRLKLDSINSRLLDVRLTKQEGANTIDTKSIRFDPKYGLGVMNTKVNYTNDFLNMRQQSEFKYIIHVDGNVNAYRLLTTMTTGSLILRVMSPYTSWTDHMIKAKVHYIPVKEDLSDLLDVIKWCKKNDERCRGKREQWICFCKVCFKQAIYSVIFESNLVVSLFQTRTQ